MSDCVEWDRACDSRGYGRRWFNGEMMWAHRAAWLEVGREILEGHIIHHDCENPKCVNVDHLRSVSKSEHRWIHAARITHCKRGHEYTPENMYMNNGRHQQCRACNRDLHRARRREAAKATEGTVF